MRQERTKNYYRQKADEVINYINNNLDGDLSIKRLAELAYISHFHFHRIMKAIINEPLGSYIDKVRLETAVKLLRYSDSSFMEIALKIGYQDLSSFSRAFSKQFGISPQMYRSNKSVVLNTNIDFRITETASVFASVKPKFLTLPDKKVLCVEVIGKYGGEEVEKAWEELSAFVRTNRIIGWNRELFSLYYDDPDTIGAENCRSEVCIAVKKNVKCTGRIKQRMISGGNFTMYRYKGPHERLWDLYDYIYKNRIVPSDLKLRNAPFLEKYCGYSKNTSPEQLITEIYLPIE